MPKNEAIAKDSIVIPGEAIRLRILANSDSGPDQEIKRKVRDAVNAQITLWVQDLTSLEKAKEVIQSKVPEIQKIAEKIVAEQTSQTYKNTLALFVSKQIIFWFINLWTVLNRIYRSCLEFTFSKFWIQTYENTKYFCSAALLFWQAFSYGQK